MAQPTPELTRPAPWLRARRAFGLLLLALFAGYHVWVQWPALYGRDAWMERVHGFGMSTLVGACVLALVAIHAGLDVLRLVRGRDLTPTAASRERFQAATGLLLALFVLCHLVHVWPEPDGVTATLARSHQRLWAALGRPAVLAVYVIGCGALAGHLVHGLWRSFESRVPSVLWTPLRLLLGFSGFLLFVCYLQVIARFAAGEPLFPGIAADPRAPAEQAQLDR